MFLCLFVDFVKIGNMPSPLYIFSIFRMSSLFLGTWSKFNRANILFFFLILGLKGILKRNIRSHSFDSLESSEDLVDMITELMLLSAHLG